MNRQLTGRRGFTVIEVTLFLSITGLMMLGIFVGISGAISRQIYESEVISLIDFIQGEYGMVDNVRNNRPTSTSCSAAAEGSGLTYGGSSTVVGSSDCTLVGRLIISGDSATQFVSRPVYSTIDTTGLPTDVSERQYLKSMRLRIQPTSQGVDQAVHLTRGEVYTNGDTDKKHFSILIVKLPTSGMTRTYVIDRNITGEDGEGIIGLLDDSNTNIQPLRLCVDPGGFGAPQAMGVRIVPSAGSVAGVQRISASDSGDQGC